VNHKELHEHWSQFVDQVEQDDDTVRSIKAVTQLMDLCSEEIERLRIVRNDKIAEMYLAGRSQTNIQQLTNLSKTQVAAIIREHPETRRSA